MIRVGIVGTGWIAEIHAKILTQLGIPIAAVVGHSKEKTRSFAEKWNIPCYGTELELLYAPEICSVHLCTPPSGHYAILKELVFRDKHILCEKPLCLDYEQACELAELVKKQERLYSLGFNVRFYHACQKAREVVQSSDFGRVLLIHGSYLQEFGASPAQWSWRYEDKMHAVTEIGSHWLDLAQFISGKRITEVSALFDRFHPQRYLKNGHLYNESVTAGEPVEVSSEDAAVISLRFEDGAIGSVVLSELSHGRGNSLSLGITGEKQSLWWNSEDCEKLFTAQKGEQPKIYSFADDFEDTFQNLIKNFYGAIQGEGKNVCASFSDGRDNVRLCEAIWSSAMTNSQWIEV